ncbi:PAS domain-containing protein, partial [Acinetobacter baumannii]
IGLLALALMVFRPAIKQIRNAIAGVEEAENRLDGIVSSMGEGLLQLNGENAIVFANESFERVLGYTAQEAVGKLFHDLVHPIRLE